MLRASAFTVVALYFFLLPLQGLAQSQAPSPIRIPKEGEGYRITKNDTSRPAPSGYEGRTDIATLNAVGTTPETMGKSITARFELGNQIKTCPAADGTAEGKGVFSMSIESTTRQANGATSTIKIEMRTVGNYKGQVGDDAWLMNPVNAEIDYTYTQTGTMRDPSGAIATPAGSNIAQHITLPFAVSRGLEPPSVGAFSGGDPTAGKYGEAVGAGTALVYWAGVYYAVAQTRWRQENTCVEVDFTPSSYSVRVVPGGRTTVKADIKTKGGESVKGNFQGVRVRTSGGTVSPPGGASPIEFAFTAPTQRVQNPGFVANATSRAGIAYGEWFAGLGTDWSGRISYSVITSGDQGSNELQTWSNSTVQRLSITLRDGKGTATAYSEVHYLGVRRQHALRGGAKTIIFESSDVTDGVHQETVPATVEVNTVTPGTYSVRVEHVFKGDGKANTESCSRNRPCTTSQQQVPMASLPSIDGRTDDPNRLSGTKSETRTGAGYQGRGTVTTILTWELSREGTSR